MCVCQLALTVGLLAVVVYLYTVVAFNFFRKFYNKSDDKDTQDMKCNDMLTVSWISILTHCLSTFICFLLSSLSVDVDLSQYKHSHTLIFSPFRSRGVEEDSDGDPHSWNKNNLLS